MADHIGYLKKKILNINKENILITSHAQNRILQRQLNVEEIIENILNFENITSVEKQNSYYGEKFKCCFEHGVKYSLVMVIGINGVLRIITVHKIKKSRQLKYERKLKHQNIRSLR